MDNTGSERIHHPTFSHSDADIQGKTQDDFIHLKEQEPPTSKQMIHPETQ